MARRSRINDPLYVCVLSSSNTTSTAGQRENKSESERKNSRHHGSAEQSTPGKLNLSSSTLKIPFSFFFNALPKKKTETALYTEVCNTKSSVHMCSLKKRECTNVCTYAHTTQRCTKGVAAKCLCRTTSICRSHSISQRLLLLLCFPSLFFFFRSQLCCDFKPNGSTLCLNEKNQLDVYGAATLLLCSPPTPSLSMQRKFTSEHFFHFSAVIILPFLVFYQSLILPFVCLYGCQRRFVRVHRRRGRPLHENKS